MIRHLALPKIAGFVVATILFGLVTISSAPVAGAHAVLETSSPADQSVVEGSPERVVLSFNEPVTFGVGAIRVFDSAGERVDEGVTTYEGESSKIGIALQPELASGSYAVAWRLISADSHPVHGGFVFSVHQSDDVADLDALIDQPSQPGYEIAGATLRGLGYLGSFVVVGAAVYLAFVRRGDRPAARTAGILTGIGIGTVVAQLLQIPIAAALATAGGLDAMFASGVLGEVLGQGVGLTHLGVALAVAAALVAVRTTGPVRRVAAVAALVLVSAAFTASGHSRTRDPVWLTLTADAVHVAAAAVWVGGVAMLVGALWHRSAAEPPEDAKEAAATVVRFSRLATVAIAAVAVAGVVMAVLEVGSIEGLFTTAYGLLVLAKVALLVLLAGLGSFNQFRLIPGLRTRPRGRARWRYLRRTLRAEAVAMVAILAVSAVLVNAIPARTEVDTRAIYSTSAQLGDDAEAPSANLVIDPARTGPTGLHLYLLDPQGRPDDDLESIQVALTQTELDLGPLTHELRRAGPGHYLINGTLFTVPGEWTVRVQVRIDEFTERTADMTVQIPR